MLLGWLITPINIAKVRLDIETLHHSLITLSNLLIRGATSNSDGWWCRFIRRWRSWYSLWCDRYPPPPPPPPPPQCHIHLFFLTWRSSYREPYITDRSLCRLSISLWNDALCVDAFSHLLNRIRYVVRIASLHISSILAPPPPKKITRQIQELLSRLHVLKGRWHDRAILVRIQMGFIKHSSFLHIE